MYNNNNNIYLFCVRLFTQSFIYNPSEWWWPFSESQSYLAMISDFCLLVIAYFTSLLFVLLLNELWSVNVIAQLELVLVNFWQTTVKVLPGCNWIVWNAAEGTMNLYPYLLSPVLYMLCVLEKLQPPLSTSMRSLDFLLFHKVWQ